MNAVLAGLVAAIIALATAHGRTTPYDNYVLFAYSIWFDHHLWIDPLWPGPAIDAVLFDGHRYIVNDPVPGLLMIPLVAFVGVAANQTLLACLLCGLAVGAAYRFLERIGVTTPRTIWLVVFSLFGTDLLWCSMLGDVWFVAETSAVAFVMLALCELAGKRRGWLVALWMALALGSRFTLVMALPVVLWWTWDGFLARERRPRSALAFVAAMIPFFVAWIAYNEARWHTPWDAGHTIFYHEDPFMGSKTGSPFGLANVPTELYSFFVVPPMLHNTFPYVEPLTFGTALWFTSPALLFALLARAPARLVVTLWLATLLVAAPSLLYYANGGSQFGMRHALDFEPFLLALMGLAARRPLGLIWRGAQALIVVSAVVGIWGCWYWSVFLRQGT
ncbi:MAG: hypothetical protein JO103_13925 [Candidatus Eremiobacteraeota bacterium]|nr:hypothetical protein [Candidatus Eremiobacteraeota bacterium]MBV9407997.1 hypothetical protein [Candidatus Eremiobacteraeota bacterium]